MSIRNVKNAKYERYKLYIISILIAAISIVGYGVAVSYLLTLVFQTYFPIEISIVLTLLTVHLADKPLIRI